MLYHLINALQLVFPYRTRAQIAEGVGLALAGMVVASLILILIGVPAFLVIILSAVNDCLENH